MTDTPHAPTPWTLYNKPLRPQFSRSKIIEIQDARGNAVIPWAGFDDIGVGSHNKRRDIAKRIIRAVNARDDLVNALEEIVRIGAIPDQGAEHRRAKWDEMWNIARAALAKAGGAS